MEKRLAPRGRLDREELSKEILIADCGPALFEMDDFFDECVDEFLKKHMPPIIKNSKFNMMQVRDKLTQIQF